MTIAAALTSHAIAATFEAPLAAFVTLFETWNQRINLSAARTRTAIEEHVVDSLAVIPYLRSARHVLDVGSGGGFPVVVAAICLPDVEFVALEPVHKKHAFLRTAARTLELLNLESLAERVEDHSRADYDIAMSRATFELDDWLTLAATKVRTGGEILGFEGLTTQLKTPVERFPYVFLDKTRAIVRRKL